MKRLVVCLLALASWSSAGTVYMLLGDGQSLSNGAYGCNAISTSQSYGNQMYNGSALVSLIENKACQNNSNTYSSGATYYPYSTALVSGTEYTTTSQTTNTPPAAPWASVTTQETPLSAAMNNAAALTSSAFSGVANNFGQNGTPISTWGSASAITSMVSTVTAVKALVSPNSLVVIGVLATGGESDFAGGSSAGANGSCSYAAGATAYYANNICFQTALQTAIQTATGQTQPMPVIYSQISSMMGYNTYDQTCPDGTASNCIDAYPVTSTASRVPIAQYQLARDSANPSVCGTAGYPACNTFYMTGPKYHLDYGSNQGPHLSALGYNMLGAETASILACLYRAGFSQNNSCVAGVMPKMPVYYSGNTVTLQVATPGGLSLDQPANAATTTGSWSNGVIPVPYYGSTPSQKTNYGFQFFQTVGGSAQEIAVTNVAVSGTTITLTLASAPASNATNLQLAYAFEGLHYAPNGSYGCLWNANPCDGITPTGNVIASGSVHGNIRTVQDTAYSSGNSLHGDAMYHWMPHFIENVVPAPLAGVIGGGGISGGVLR